ncbi:uncharacterized protein LOC134837752 [Culicoides brevitarsis]|uniref:uncharacterized protein LOC134837752 n=1 Tax=Culicoides brevitarsis TaxID=469753 RepID=UPI00307BCFEC
MNKKIFLLIFCCVFCFEARGQLFPKLKPVSPAKGPKASDPILKNDKPHIVLPDHLKDKEDDDFEAMKQKISEGFGLKIGQGSYDEAADLRTQIQVAQKTKPNKANLDVLGGSKVKSSSGSVASLFDDPSLSSVHLESVASHPVVLPDHLKEPEEPKNPSQGEHLNIDQKSFMETAIIRDKIKEAQETDTYAHTATDLGGSQSLYDSPFSLGATKSNETTSKTSSFSDKKLLLNKNIFTNREFYGANGELLKHEALFNKSKNIWHGKVGHGQHLRDQLALTQVAVNVNFIIGEGADIEMWKAFRKFSNKHALTLIAMTNNGLLLVQEQNGQFEVLQHLEMQVQTIYAEVFEKWDDTTSSWLGVVIVSTPTEIVWYESKGEHTKLEEVWRWNVHKKMLQVKYFRHKNTDLVLLVNDATPSSADIYEFDYFSKSFWIAQVIPLDFPSTSVGILRYGDGFLICLPQKDDVRVYEYQKTTFDHGRLIFKESVEAPNVTMVAGFTVGGYTYLAIGGSSSRILMFTGDAGFVEQKIVGDQLTNVVFWFPIHVQTYRDDLLLLALRETEYHTHTTLDIKGVVWNLDSFRVTPNIPCYDDEEDLTKGLTCILDPYRKEGLWGSGFVQHHNHLTLVIPQNEAPSALYDLYYEIVPAPDPVIEELEKIEETYELLADIVEHQDRVVEFALETIKNALNVEAEVNYVTEKWEFAHLGAQKVELTENVAWKNDQILFGTKPWTSLDQKRDLTTLEEFLAKSEAEVELVTSEISYNRPLRYSDSPFYPINAVNNGQFRIETLNVLPTEFEEKNSYDDLNREKRHLVVAGPVEFETLEVQELQVENINGIRASDIIFGDDPVIELNGPVTFENVVSVEQFLLGNEGKVNGIDLDRDLVHFTNPVGIKNPLKFEFLEAIDGVDAMEINPKTEEVGNPHTEDSPKVLEVQKLEVNGNLNAKIVNNLDWNEFVSSVVPRNLPTNMPQLTVNGTVFVDHSNLDVVHLNQLNFVNDLVFGSSQDSYVQISGKKSFNSGLFAQQIDCETLDGIVTTEVITLGDYQKIPGRSVFSSLEVSDDLEVNGKIQGEKLDDFEENLTLEQSRVVDASTIFVNLRVEGPIKIRDTFNDKTIDEALGNVIYTDNGTVVVNSYKHFKKCDFEEGINIRSGLVNEIDTKNIVTKSTEQYLSLNHLTGDVLFQNLDLDGLFDFVNATELDMNTVKLHGDQYSEVSMSVRNPVHAKSLKIEKNLNGYALNDYHRVTEELHLAGKVSFNELLIDQANVAGGIHTNGLLNGVNLKIFDETRLSLTRPQHITAPAHLKYVTIHGNLRNELINQVSTTSFSNNVLKAQSVRNLMYSGEILIDNLYVDNNVAINRLNGVDLNHLLENVVWLDRPCVIYGDMKFLDGLEVHGNVSYNSLLNGHHFESFLGDLVLKNQEILYWKGHKGFSNGFSVTSNIDTEYINDVNVQNILRRDGSVACQGHLNVMGHVDVRHLDVKGTLNNNSVHDLASKYDFDSKTDRHVIKKDANLHESCTINDLVVNGPFNSMRDITSYLNSIVRDDKSYNISGRKTFLNLGLFDQGVEIYELNNLPLTEFLKDIVLVNAAEKNVINSLVSFHEPVFAPTIHVENDIATHNIADCSPQEWVYNGILVNEHESIMTSLHFNSENLVTPGMFTVNLNGKPVDDVVTLHSAQHFSLPLAINELYLTGSIDVGGLVNGVKLPLEMENTLKIYGGQQHIAAYSTSFASLRVLQDLTVEHLNGYPTSNIAFLNEDLYFDSPLEFKSLEVSSLNTIDHISGVDFNYWCDHSLVTGPLNAPQKVFKNWTIDNLYLESPMSGNGLLNHVKMDEIVQKIASSKNQTDENIVGVAREYQDVCHNIQAMSENARTGIYFFKYFEQKFELRPLTRGKLHNSHHFSVGNAQFVLLNIDCMSEIYQWNLAEQKFVRFDENLHTGYVSEVLVLKNDSLLILATPKDGCEAEGVSLLKFVSLGELTLVQNLKEKIQNLHKKSQNNAFFYGLLDNSKVVEYNEGLQQVEEWLLPETVTEYRFLPHELGIGLALSDGRTVVSLSSMQNGARFRRQTDENQEKLKFSHVLRAKAAEDLLQTTSLPFDEGNPDRSPAWKYLHNEADVVKVNLEQHKHQNLPHLKSQDEQFYENLLRKAVSDVNRKFSDLKEKIVASPKSDFSSKNENLEPFKDSSDDDQVSYSKERAGAELHERGKTYSEEIDLGDHFKSTLSEWKEASNVLKGVLLTTLKMVDKIDDLVGDSQNASSPQESLSTEDETQLSSNLREFVSKWNQKPQETTTKNADDDFVSQENDLKGIIQQQLPNFKNSEDREFSESIRNLVSKWNKKVAELKTALNVEPIVAQTQILEDLVQKELPKLTSAMKNNEKISSLVNDWNEKATSLKDAINSSRVKDEFEPFLTQMNELKPFVDKLASLPSSEEREFAEQLLSAVAKWNEVTYKVNNILKNPKKYLEEQGKVDARTKLMKIHQTEETKVAVTQESTTLSPKFDKDMQEQLSKWNQFAQKLPEKVTKLPKIPEIDEKSTEEPSLQATESLLTTKTEEATLAATENLETTQDPTLSITELTTSVTTEEPKLAITEAQTTKSPVLVTKLPPKDQKPAFSRPDDVQMMPDLKKTLFVEQEDSFATTSAPDNRFFMRETTPANVDSRDSTTEPTVAQAMNVGGVQLMENFFLPAKKKGEIVLLNVGIEGQQRKLIAVSSVVNRRSTIPTQHGVIQIYEDIFEGKLFQSIPCYQPSGLSVIHMRDETLLTFLEGNSGVRVYAYRGIQGFVQLSNFNLPKVAHSMQHVKLHQEVDQVHECAKDFLAVTTESDVLFYQAKTEPESTCVVKASFKCD